MTWKSMKALWLVSPIRSGSLWRKTLCCCLVSTHLCLERWIPFVWIYVKLQSLWKVFRHLNIFLLFKYSSMLPHYAKESKQFNLLSIIYAQYTGMKTDFRNFAANSRRKFVILHLHKHSDALLWQLNAGQTYVCVKVSASGWWNDLQKVKSQTRCLYISNKFLHFFFLLLHF